MEAPGGAPSSQSLQRPPTHPNTPTAPPAVSGIARMAQTQNPSNAPSAAAAGAQKTSAAKKRKIPSGEFQNSCYFKIRSIVKELRPTFLEVVHAAEFRDCKASCDIKKKMKTILELYKQLRVETPPPAPSERKSSFGEYMHASTDYQEKPDAKTVPPHPSGIPAKQDDAHQVCESNKEPKPQVRVADSPEAKVATATKGIEQQLQGVKGSYVIGGSPIGWNFIAYSNDESVYYGLTKEAWRAKQAPSS